MSRCESLDVSLSSSSYVCFDEKVITSAATALMKSPSRSLVLSSIVSIDVIS